MSHEADVMPRGTHAMAMVRWGLVAVMGLAALASFASYFGWLDRLGGGAHDHAQPTVYYCPMHPAVRQDHPGECPICGMTLVPLEETPAAPAAPSEVPGLVPVTLSGDRIQLMGMRTATVARETFAPELRAPGGVAPSEKGLAVIPVRFAGWIEELLVEQTGQKVAKGQVLARIYSPELLTAQQEFVAALRWRSSAAAGSPTASLADDARRRLELLGISRQEIAELERSGTPARALAVRSPVAGVVTAKNVVQGAYVQPGQELFAVADLTTVWVLAEVHEHEAARVEPGQRAAFAPTAYPGETFGGKVAFIAPVLDPATRTLRVRLELANPKQRLKPGMYGDVRLAGASVEALVVPTDALIDTGEHQYVFVSLDGGRFEPRHVRAGARQGGRVQILDGLREGEVVVTTGNFLLDSESRLQATLAGGSSAAAPGHQHQGTP